MSGWWAGGGGGGGRGGWRVLPAGGIHASQGTFSSFKVYFTGTPLLTLWCKGDNSKINLNEEI